MISDSDTKSPRNAHLIPLSISALGVVFGDIGTSPLYTFKTVLALSGGNAEPKIILGSLSLILWTLIIITTVKYVHFAMRIDNGGEGGILALMSLLGVKPGHRRAIVIAGLMGAALVYGDGAITPAISVLSALEGLNIVTPSFQPYILPASIFILIALFAFQSRGTARIGKTFGPVMGLWFLIMAILGIRGIIHHPSVLFAINPVYGLTYLFSGGFSGFLVLGGVFLCVTGAEALYADMGHFGAKPIRLVWSGLVFPSLILNYAGQAALVLEGAPVADNIFYRLCPSALLVPLVVLATVATIIASQSIITGAFSMTRQAIQLGWLPRLHITQTSAEGYGQIYVRIVNWLLMIATVGLTVGFGKSDNLAAAYGIAVSATMLVTSGLLFMAMRDIWHWSPIKAGTIASLFIIVDSAFFTANLSKIMEGGYVPVIFAGCVFGIMLIWHKGTEAVAARLKETAVPIDIFMANAEKDHIVRVPGTAVFLTRSEQDTPPVMVWHVRQNRSLHEQLFLLKVKTQSVPWVKNAGRLTVQEIAPNVWRGVAAYGFMEQPNIPKLLKQAHKHGCNLNLKEITYYVGHETIISRDDGKGLPTWAEGIYTFMQRNSLHVSEYFQLPLESVVEIGRQIEI